MIRVQGKVTSEQAKRFRLRGVRIEGDCPLCNCRFSIDGKEHYLSHPLPGRLTPLYFCCPGCEEGLEVEIEVQINLVVHGDVEAQ